MNGFILFRFVSFSYLFRERDVEFEASVAFEEVEIAAFVKVLGGTGDILVLELDLDLAATIVLAAEILVENVEREDHVIEGVDVEGKGVVPDGVSFALLDRGDLGPVVVVLEKIVLFESDLDVGIGLSNEILVGQVGSLDKFDGKNTHDEI